MSKRVSLSEGSFFGILIFATLLLNGCGGGGSSPRSDVSGVDTTAPTVESTSPVNGATDVLLNTTISATFSEAINEATLPNNFIVSAVSGGSGGTVSGSLSFSPGLKTATFLLPPSTTLTPNTIYNVTIATGITDLANPPNPLATSFSWAFTTGSSIDNTAPSFAGNNPQLNASPTSSSSIFLSWNAATDNTTPANEMHYVICQSTTDGGCSGVPFPSTGVVLHETVGTTNLSVTGLQSGTYFFVVRAKDSVNLMDENTAQASAKTFGTFVSLGGSQNANCAPESSTRLCSSDATSPSITIIGSTLYLSWAEANNVYVRTLNTTSKAWSSAGPLPLSSPGNKVRQPNLVSNGTSTPTPYITYTECDNVEANCKIVVRQLSSGNWVQVGTALNIDLSKSASDSAMAFDSNGVPYVVWVEPDGSGAKQVVVKHLNGAVWEQDGTSLNVGPSNDGMNPAIAINGTTIKVAWSECIHNSNNCQLYVKTLNGSAWTPASPDSLKAVFSGTPSDPNDPSLAFVNGVIHLAWHESGKGYVRREEGGAFTSPVEVANISGASNVSLRATATAIGSQVPYLVFADNATATRIFVKRWNGTEWNGTAWVTEGDLSKNNGALNMTGGASQASTLDSSIAFLQGTPYVVWSERGACNVPAGSSPFLVCGQNSSSAYQIYVKRLE